MALSGRVRLLLGVLVAVASASAAANERQVRSDENHGCPVHQPAMACRDCTPVIMQRDGVDPIDPPDGVYAENEPTPDDHHPSSQGHEFRVLVSPDTDDLNNARSIGVLAWILLTGLLQFALGPVVLLPLWWLIILVRRHKPDWSPDTGSHHHKAMGQPTTQTTDPTQGRVR